MTMWTLLVCLVALATQARADDITDNIAVDIAILKQTVGQLSRQLMLQQLAMEERVRSEGDSGIKQIRSTMVGTRPYHNPSFTGNSVASIHNHANNIRTVGLGEFIAVLNGVEFRTRHNDFRMNMPSTTSNAYDEIEEIPFPEVPPEVMQYSKVKDQIAELKEWFRAFKNQNYTVRDYRPYFRPVLCYLEGAWTMPSEVLEESFDSDRHILDAGSWFDMQDKVRFTSYTGRKSNLENYAYLPTTIIDVKNGLPVHAQWNYRILCHPISRDLPTNRLRVIDDFGCRMAQVRKFEEMTDSRGARFQVNPYDSDEFKEGTDIDGLLDELMAEIPGKDNYYKANLTDDAFGLPALELHRRPNSTEDTPLNTAYYHRWYKVSKKGAMGTQTNRRGFSDANMFMAMTSQEKIAPLTLEACNRRKSYKRDCKTYSQRWSYAIPLEIIYMTPLSTWNPYHLEYKGEAKSILGKTVTADGRNGRSSFERAWNGTNSRVYYLTPAEFFRADQESDPADTSRGSAAVLDRNGQIRFVKPSGHRIVQYIPGVGKIRQRYPIMPIHGEGSAVWKEVEAVKDIVLEPSRYAHMYRENVQINTGPSDEKDNDKKGLTLMLTEGQRADHDHELRLSSEQVMALMRGEALHVVSEESGSHTHNIELIYKTSPQNLKSKFLMQMCDDRRFCEHPRVLEIYSD